MTKEMFHAVLKAQEWLRSTHCFKASKNHLSPLELLMTMSQFTKTVNYA